MRIEIWSDVVCPWCYIGKRRFERALAAVAAQRDVTSLDIVYRPYQLDPGAAPDRSEPVADAYAKKFGGPDRAAELIANVTGVAAAEGIEFHLEHALRANTKRAHRLLWFAEQQPDGAALQRRLKERLMRCYFTDGEDIGSIDTLVRAATDVGIDADSAAQFLRSEHGEREVDALLASGVSQGVTAVPTYVINGQWALPGAQDSSVFERVLNKMLDAELAADESPAAHA